MGFRRAFTATVLVTATLAGLLVTAGPASAVASGANGWIAFVSDRDGDREIYITRADGSAVVQLTDNTFDDFDPNIAPIGAKIVFVSDRSGLDELWTMRIDGTGAVKLTTNTITESHPVWDPKSGMIAYAGFNGTDSEIYKTTASGQGTVNLTRNPTAFDANPAWSPGGLFIAFDSTNRDGDPGTNIYTVENNGLNVVKLTTTGVDSHPNWAPDNRNLTFVSRRDQGPSEATHFADILMPVGLAFSPTAGMLVTQNNKDHVRAVSDAGVTTTFADLPPTGNATLERYIAVNPGLGCWAPKENYVYVTVRKDILEISPDGSTVEVFATIPALANSNNSVNFDTVGTFGFDLLLASGPKADLWRIACDGTRSRVVDLELPQELEDPEVAPLDYAPYGGQVIVSSKLDNSVYAIDVDGNVTFVGPWDAADDVAFVPSTVCSYGNSGGAFFLAMRDENRILKMPAERFDGVTGALIPDETETDIGLFHSNGVSIEISQFSQAVGGPELEGTAFADCSLANRPATGEARTGTQGDVVAGEIYKMTSSGTGQVRLTNNSAEDTSPAFSPDGAQIVFQSALDDAAGCEDTGGCVYETYTMTSSGGSPTNISDNLAANDTTPDWQMLSFPPVEVSDNVYDPRVARPQLGGSVMWDFFGPTAHTATDDSGMGLFDSGIKSAGTYYVFVFGTAGSYPFICTIHPLDMDGDVKAPMKATPRTGDQTTQFTITWASFVPVGYRVDIQIQRPGAADFVDWITDTTAKSSTFVADAGTGDYLFKARLERLSNLATSDYSAPVTITVNP
jgi:Tol biopolymer transport system component